MPIVKVAIFTTNVFSEVKVHTFPQPDDYMIFSTGRNRCITGISFFIHLGSERTAEVQAKSYQAGDTNGFIFVMYTVLVHFNFLQPR